MESLTGRLSSVPNTNNYEAAFNKPKINGVELSGDISFERLGMDTSFAGREELEALENRLNELIDGNEVAF